MSLGLDQGLVKEIEARFGKTVTTIIFGLFLLAVVGVCINLIGLFLVPPIVGVTSGAIALLENSDGPPLRDTLIGLGVNIAQLGLSLGLLWIGGRWVEKRALARSNLVIAKLEEALAHSDATIDAMYEFERKRAALIPSTDEEGRARSAEIMKEAEALYEKAMEKASSTGGLLGSLSPSAARRNAG